MWCTPVLVLCLHDAALSRARGARIVHPIGAIEDTLFDLTNGDGADGQAVWSERPKESDRVGSPAEIINDQIAFNLVRHRSTGG